MADDFLNEITKSFPNYAIIEFVKRGRKSAVRTVDIIPFSWVEYERKGGRYSTRFLEDTTHEEDVEMLHNLVKSLSPPPESWPYYNISVLGQSNDYKDAEAQLQELKTKKNVSTDEEVENILVQIKKKKLCDSANEARKKLQDISNNSTKEDNSNNNIVIQNKSNNCNNEEYNISNIVPTVNNSVNKSDNVNKYSSSPIKLPLSTSSQKNSDFSDDFTIINDSDIVQLRPGFESVVVGELSTLKAAVSKNYSAIEQIQTFLLDKSINSANISITSFKLKYKINIPFDDNDDFINFNKMINSNMFMREDLMAQLHKCMDADLVITKSFLHMIKTFLSKNLAVLYTASRKSDNPNFKGVFKNTTLYTCMVDAVTRARKSTNLPIDESKFTQALSDVLTNARNWPNQ